MRRPGGRYEKLGSTFIESTCQKVGGVTCYVLIHLYLIDKSWGCYSTLSSQLNPEIFDPRKMKDIEWLELLVFCNFRLILLHSEQNLKTF